MEHIDVEKTKRNIPKPVKFIGFGILGVIGVAALAFIFGYFVMLLWNNLMPEIFSLSTITYFQAFGLIILARLLFGGFKHPRHDDQHPGTNFGSRISDKFRGKFCSDENGKDWSYYDKYWNEEGNKSFSPFVNINYLAAWP